jgi:hypothetical protein
MAAPRDDLIQHLIGSMEKAGLEVEAADASGYAKPRQTKALGLRRRRARPDVIAKDGRRTVFGAALADGDAGVSDHLETLARHCRVLVICISDGDADQAIQTLFFDQHLPHWHKMRILRYPAEGWQELPKAAGRKRS